MTAVNAPLLGFLFSYHYCKKVDLDGLLGPLTPAPPLFADSGAFSAHTLGSAITVRDYAAWLERWAHLFPVYANLDVLDDCKATARNQKALERRGLVPVPVFHGGEQWKVLEGMVEQYEYVALGGMASGSVSRGSKLVGWLDRCFSLGEGKCVYHGFGMTKWELVRRFPWRSVDSSSIGSGYRYGTVKTYEPFSKRWVAWRVTDRSAWGKHGWLVREYGLTPADFAVARSQECTRAIIRLATRSMRRAIADLPATQLYVAEVPGVKQGGVERVAEFAKANGGGPQMFIADTSLPSTAEDDGSMRVDTFNAANGEPGAKPRTSDPRSSARRRRSEGLKGVGTGPQG